MLRKFTLLFILTFVFHTAQSQVIISLLLGDKLNTGKIEFGLDGGLNLANQSGLEGSDNLRTFNLGFYFDFKLKKEPWMVHTGVIVKSNLGADDLPVYSLKNTNLDSVFLGGDVQRKLSYFNVPVMMKYKFKTHFYAEAGIQLGLLYKAFDNFSNVYEDNTLTYSKDVSNRYYALDGGLRAGLGYRLFKGNGMNLGVGYYYGLVDVLASPSGNNANRSWYFTAGIPIGVAKAKKKAESGK
jgi:Outer membrane protein beta-barrel domain